MAPTPTSHGVEILDADNGAEQIDASALAALDQAAAWVLLVTATGSRDKACTLESLLGLVLKPSDITSGTITAGTGDIDFDALGGAESPLTLTASTATETPLTVKGAASQTAKLQEWKNSAGTVVGWVSPDGGILSQINAMFGYSQFGVYAIAKAYGSSVAAFSHYGYINISGHAKYSWAPGGFGTSIATHPDTSIGRASAGVVRAIAGHGDTLGDFESRRSITTEGTNFLSGSSDPTTTDIPAGYGARWKNTTSGEIRDWVNDGGTMKKSAAYT